MDDNAAVLEVDGETDYFLSSQKSYKLQPVPISSNTLWRSSWSSKTVKQSFWRRLPKTKPVLYLLLLNLLQAYGFYMLSDLLTLQNSVFKRIDSADVSPIRNVIIIGFPSLFYPLGGILGDVYLGRHTISLVCLFILWISSIILTVILVACSYVSTNLVLDVVIPVILLVVIGAVDGVFQINWLTFGADQLCNAPTEEVSSFIYYWYWSKNVGIVLAIFTNTALSRVSTVVAGYGGFSPLIAAVALTVALILHKLCKDNFDTEWTNMNPIKHICGVLCNAASSRPRHSFISAFRYGEDPPSGLEYARQYHGGKYTDEQVQDVRSFARIAIMIVTLSGFMATYAAFLNMMNYEMKQSSHELSYLQSQLGTITINMVVVLFVPFWNNLIFPLMSHYLPNSRKRIGFGLAISTVALIVAAVIQNRISSGSDELEKWLVLPTIAFGIAETSVFIPILEFIYAQSPDNMKGLLIGCHYFLIGVWSVVASAIFYKLLLSARPIMWYYIAFSIVSLIGLILFSFMSCFYRNRQRNNPISDILRISMYYK